MINHAAALTGHLLHSKVQTGVTCYSLCVFKALLLHGSLPEDEQDVSLALEQGNTDQQLVIVSPFIFIFSSRFFICQP